MARYQRTPRPGTGTGGGSSDPHYRGLIDHDPNGVEDGVVGDYFFPDGRDGSTWMCTEAPSTWVNSAAASGGRMFQTERVTITAADHAALLTTGIELATLDTGDIVVQLYARTIEAFDNAPPDLGLYAPDRDGEQLLNGGTVSVTDVDEGDDIAIPFSYISDGPTPIKQDGTPIVIAYFAGSEPDPPLAGETEVWLLVCKAGAPGASGAVTSVNGQTGTVTLDIPAWQKVFDLNDESDLSAFEDNGDPGWSLVDGVIVWDGANGANGLLDLYASVLGDAPLAAWSLACEVRIRAAIPAAATANLNDDSGSLVQFDDAGNVKGALDGNTEAAVIDDWYAVSHTVCGGYAGFIGGDPESGLAGTGAWKGQVADVDPIPVATAASDAVYAVEIRTINDDGTLAFEVRNLVVHVLRLLALPA